MVRWEVSDAGADPFPPRYGRWHAGKRKGAAAREAPSVARTRPLGIREGQAGPTGQRMGPLWRGRPVMRVERRGLGLGRAQEEGRGR